MPTANSMAIAEEDRVARTMICAGVMGADDMSAAALQRGLFLAAVERDFDAHARAHRMAIHLAR